MFPQGKKCSVGVKNKSKHPALYLNTQKQLYGGTTEGTVVPVFRSYSTDGLRNRRLPERKERKKESRVRRACKCTTPNTVIQQKD